MIVADNVRLTCSVVRCFPASIRYRAIIDLPARNQLMQLAASGPLLCADLVYDAHANCKELCVMDAAPMKQLEETAMSLRLCVLDVLTSPLKAIKYFVFQIQ